MEGLIIIGFVILFWKINRIEKLLYRLEQKMHRQKSLPKKIVLPNLQEEEREEEVYEAPQSIIKEEVLVTTNLLEEPMEKEKPKISFKKKVKQGYSLEGIEEMLFGNIILKIGVIAFILGIGLFLKYSIDKNWIPVWGRAMIGIGVGMMMLLGGIKLIKNENKLFSEGLFGGGIAILYLSIFAGFALKGFAFLPFGYAFGAMLMITFLAGVISIKFDAKSTAIFGLIGGFLTPFLINTGSGNVVGLLSYMLMLNFGILYISVYKKWSILSWMAFVITAVTQLGSSFHHNAEFTPMLLLFGSFFIIYSIVPFINEIRQKENALSIAFVLLFVANFFVGLGSFYLLFDHENIQERYFTMVTIAMATYLLLYAGILGQKNLFLKNLFYIVLAQAIALLLFTPALIFSGVSLTIIWAIESLMLLWIANKSSEPTYAFFAFIGFTITLFRYIIFDLSQNIFISSYYFTQGYEEALITLTQSFAITTFFVLGSLFMAYKIILKSTLDVTFRDFSNEFLAFMLFILSFILIFISLVSIGHNILSDNYFLMLFMVLIALFSGWLSSSYYVVKGKWLFYALFSLLFMSFVMIVEGISPSNVTMSMFEFLLFSVVFVFVYTFGFKENKQTIRDYRVGNLIVSLGVGLLFIFLNVELINILTLLKPEASKFGVTLLWVIFGITLFVFGIIKEVKMAKITATLLIFLAILKAFLVDLSHLDYIFKILLFIVLGMLLFGLSYFYQSKNKKEIKE